jgi:hypothetical protein
VEPGIKIPVFSVVSSEWRDRRQKEIQVRKQDIHMYMREEPKG